MKKWEEMTPAEQRAWLVSNVPLSQTVQTRMRLASGQADQAALLSLPNVAGGVQWSAPEGQATECCLVIGGGEIQGSFRQVWLPAEVGNTVIAVEVEYGTGNVRQRVLMDVKTGSFQLPPCSFVRASLLQKTVNGAAGVTGALRIPMSLVQGVAPDAEDWTYTITAMVDGNYYFPAFARQVELVNPGRMSYVGPFGGNTIRIIQESTAASPLVSPPWSPVDLVDQLSGVNQQFAWVNEPTAALTGTCVFTVGR